MQGTHTFFNVKAAIRYKYRLQEKIKSALQVDNVEKLGILDDDHLVQSCGTLPLKLRPERWDFPEVIQKKSVTVVLQESPRPRLPQSGVAN